MKRIAPSPLQQPLPFFRKAPPPSAGRRNLVIEAGAGTGKTTSIVREVVLLLLDHPDLAPERLVLVTFTEKAAAEIADRIREALLDLYSTFDSDQPRWPSDAASPIITIAAADRERKRAACRKHLQQIDRLRSQTIHSFCQTILRAHPLEAGLGTQFTVVEGFERLRLYQQIYGEWMEAEMREGVAPERLEQWRIVYRHFERLDELEQRLFDLLPKYDLLIDESYQLGTIADAEPKLAEWLAAIRTAEPAGFGEIRNPAMLEVVEYIRGNVPPRRGTLDDWIEYFEPIAPTLEEAEVKFKHPLLPALKELRGKDKASHIYEHLIEHRVAEALRALAVRFAQFLQNEKQIRGVVDFDDLLTRARDLLRNPDVLHEVRSRYDYIYVDEFQDTDRVQAEVVDRLARDARGEFVPGKITLVGDPKQSIYSFRRADPETYGDTVQRFIAAGAEDRRLDEQYRSDPELVRALNALFNAVFRGGSDDPNVYRPTYTPLVAKASPDGRAAEARLTFLMAVQGEETSAAEAEAEALACWIRDRVAGGASHGEFAVLFRRMTNVTTYLEALDRAGIPYVLTGTSSFFEQRPAVDLLSVLRAAAYPFDRAAQVAAARSPYFALTDEEIFRHFTGCNESAETCRYHAFEATMQSLSQRALHVSVEQLIADVLELCDIESLCALTDDGHVTRSHIERFREIALDFDVSAGGSLAQFVDELGARRLEISDSEPSLVDEQADAVKVMTVHASKGLEFGTVIIPEMTHSVTRDALTVSAIEEPKSLVFTGRVKSLSGRFRTSSGRPLTEIQKERMDHEVARLFYVAVTRARSEVVFLCASGAMRKEGFWPVLTLATGREPKQFAEMFPDEGRVVNMLAMGLEAIPALFEKSSAGGLGVFDRHAVARRNLDRLTPLARPDQEPRVHEVEQLGRAEVAQRLAGSANRGTGILLHRVLQIWDGDPSKAATIVRTLAAEQLIDETGAKLALARVERLRKTPTWERLRRAEVVGREMPIYFDAGDGTAREGRIDCLVREASGYLVVDYKSGRPWASRLEHDRDQVRRYCAAIAGITGEETRGLLWYVDADEDVAVEV